MPSNRKSETARLNGAKSRGPITEDGKRASSRNALKHGIHSTQVILPHEDGEAYQQLQAVFLEEWQPATPTEETLVIDMVNARWRLQRIETLVGATIEREMESVVNLLPEDEDMPTDEALVSRAYTRNLVVGKTLETFERWEGRLHRTFQRALKTLRSLQAERQAKVGQEVSAAVELNLRPTCEQAQNENEQNEPTGSEPPVHQPLTDAPARPEVSNGYWPVPQGGVTPDLRPPALR